MPDCCLTALGAGPIVLLNGKSGPKYIPCLRITFRHSTGFKMSQSAAGGILAKWCPTTTARVLIHVHIPLMFFMMPGNRCMISSCKTVAKKGSLISLHRVPWSNPEVKAQWQEFVLDTGTMPEKFQKSSRIWSLHFEGGRSDKDSVPSLFEPGKSFPIIFTHFPHHNFIRCLIR